MPLGSYNPLLVWGAYLSRKLQHSKCKIPGVTPFPKLPQLSLYQCNFIHIPARHFQACSGVQTRFSLVPRPSKTGEGEGLVYTVCTCVLISPTPSENICTLVLLCVTITYDDELTIKCLEFHHRKVRSRFNRVWHVVLAALNCCNVCPTPFTTTDDWHISQSKTALCYGGYLQPSNVFVWLPTGYGKVCVVKSCHSSWTINMEW